MTETPPETARTGGVPSSDRLAFVYMAATVAGSLACIGWQMWEHLVVSGRPLLRSDDVVVFASIVALSLVARFLSVELGKIRVTLDTPILITAALRLGPNPTALVILCSMLVYGAYLVIRREGPYAQPMAPHRLLVRYLFAPSLTALIGWVVSSFGWEAATLAATGGEFVQLCGIVALATLTLLVLQYSLVVVAYVLEGSSLLALMREAVLPGLTAEGALAPVAVLFVWILDPRNILPFAVLGSAYVVIADIFNRLARARAQTLATVGELERLIESGTKVFSALSYDAVLAHLTAAIRSEIPTAAPAIAGIRDEDTQAFVVGVRDDLGFRVEPLGDPLRDRVERGILARAPAVLEGLEGMNQPDLALMPFVLGDEAESFIAAVVPRTSRRRATLLSVRALEQLRKLGSIAGISMHNARLYRLATVDGLTGLFVRRYFDQRHREELARAVRYHKPLSVLLVDMDDFKDINDAFGHPLGDRVLQSVARSLRQNVRSADVPCRYGGDEFVTLLPETPAVEAADIARRLKQKVESLRLLHEGCVVRFTVSIGVATLDPERKSGSTDLVELADQALYRAKSFQGKSKVVVAEPGD